MVFWFLPRLNTLPHTCPCQTAILVVETAFNHSCRPKWTRSMQNQDFFRASLDSRREEARESPKPPLNRTRCLSHDPLPSSDGCQTAFATTSLPWPASSWGRSCFCKSSCGRALHEQFRTEQSHRGGPDELTWSRSFFAFAGTQVANTPQTTAGSQSTTLPQGPNPAQLLYISLCFGFSLAVNAWIFFRVSGGLFNPAVSSDSILINRMRTKSPSRSPSVSAS